MKNKKFTRQWIYQLVFGFLLALGGTIQVFAAPNLGDPVWRAQLRVTVADAPDAGTNDSIQFKWLMNDDRTTIDSTETDFERNRTYLYDLNLRDTKNLEQASRGFAIYNFGLDTLCLKSVALLLNGQMVFEHNFQDQGYCMDKASLSLLVSEEMIRNHPLWLEYEQPTPPTVLRRAEIERRIEMLIGSALAEWRVPPFSNNEPPRLPIHWGQLRNQRFVEITTAVDRQGQNYFNVDLDLAIAGPNPEIDVDFELRVTCLEGQFHFTASNFMVRHIKRTRHDNSSEQIATFIRQFAGFLTIREMGFALALSNRDQFTLYLRKSGDVHFVATGITPTFTDESNDEARDANRRSPGSSASETETEGALQVRPARIKAGSLSENVVYSFSLTPAGESRSEVQIQVELPEGVTAPETLVIASDESGSRMLSVQLTTTQNGGTLITFSDMLAAGEATHYLVPVRFDEKSPEDSFIAAKVSGSSLPEPLAFQTGFKIALSKVFPLGMVQE